MDDSIARVVNLDKRADQQSVALDFTGSAGEYFRIWIVNVFLSVITLGIYSAWAKVRNKRYFYGNTQLDQSSFEYHGQPLHILRGRIIALFVLAVVVIASSFFPLLSAVLPLIIFIVAPIFVRQGFRFNLAMSSYRGIRFSFRGTTAGAYLAYLMWPIIAFITVYLTWPVAHRKASGYRVGHSWYGNTAFAPALRIGAFYKAYISAILVVLLMFVVVAIASFSLVDVDLILAQLQQGSLTSSMLYPLFGLLTFGAASAFFRGVVEAMCNNHIYSSTTLGSQVRFKSTLNPLVFGGLYFTNLLAILMTLGLAIPWARVRLMRYRVAHTQVFAQQGIEHFVRDERKKQSALGEEFANAFDVDLGAL